MAFSRGRDHIVPVNHPSGEAILLNRCRLSSTRSKPARALAAVALGAAAVAGVLAATAIASTPGEPAALFAPAAPAPPKRLRRRSAVPVASPIRDRIDSAADLRIGGEKMHTALLRQFYAGYDFQPVWEGRKLQAEALLRARGAGRRPWARP